MPDARIRQQIAILAARLMYERTESEYYTAKRKAARQLGLDYRFHPHDLPSNAEIRDHIQSLANLYEGDALITGWHSHEVHQIEYAVHGVVEVETDTAHYLLPPQQAADMRDPALDRLYQPGAP